MVLLVRGVKTYVTGTAVTITHLDAAFLCPVCFIPTAVMWEANNGFVNEACNILSMPYKELFKNLVSQMPLV